MIAGVCALPNVSVSGWVCVSVHSSVNTVLCSSSSSSSGPAVAARSAVYFPSWWTTSYQISRHCLRACCPTTRSQRTSRLLLQSVARRGLWRPQPEPVSVRNEAWMSVDVLHGAWRENPQRSQRFAAHLLRCTCRHTHEADLRDDEAFRLFYPASWPQLWHLW